MKLTRGTLVDLANYLDENGLIKEANEVDVLIRKYAATFGRGDKVDILDDNKWYAGTIKHVNPADPKGVLTGKANSYMLDRYYIEWRGYVQSGTSLPYKSWVSQEKISAPGEYNTDSTWLQATKEVVVDRPSEYWKEHSPTEGVIEAVGAWDAKPWQKVLLLDVVGLIPGVGTMADTAQLLMGYDGMKSIWNNWDKPPSVADKASLHPCSRNPSPESCEKVSNLLKFIRWAMIAAAGIYFVGTDIASLIAAAGTGGAAWLATEVANITSEAGVKVAKWLATSSLSWSALAFSAHGLYMSVKAMFDVLDSFLLSEEALTISPSGANNSLENNPDKKYARTTNMQFAAAVVPAAGPIFTMPVYTKLRDYTLGALSLAAAAGDDLGWTEAHDEVLAV